MSTPLTGLYVVVDRQALEIVGQIDGKAIGFASTIVARDLSNDGGPCMLLDQQAVERKILSGSASIYVSQSAAMEAANRM